MARYHRLPRYDHEVTTHRKIKHENGRQSFALFDPAGNLYRQLLPTHTTHTTLHSMTRQDPIQYQASHHIKCNEGSQFHPTYPDPWNGFPQEDPRSYRSDASSSVSRPLHRLRRYQEPDSQPFHTFGDSTLVYGKSELTVHRGRRWMFLDELRLAVGVDPAKCQEPVLDALRQRFKSDPVIVMTKLTQDRLRLVNLSRYETGNPDLTPLTFVQMKPQYAGQMGILDGDT